MDLGHGLDRRARAIAALAAGACTAACAGAGGDQTTEPVPVRVADVRILGVPSDSTLIVGQPLRLTAAVLSADGSPLTRRVTWMSTDTGRVRVDSTGLMTPLGRGPVTVFATADGLSASARLLARVALPTPGAGEAPVTLSMDAGALEFTIPAGALPAGARVFVDRVATPGTGRRVPDTEFELTPHGTGFLAPVLVRVRYPVEGRSADARSRLHLYRARGDTLAPLAVVWRDSTTHQVIAELDGGGRFVVADPSLPIVLETLSGAGQSGPMGDTLPVRPAFRARDGFGQPVVHADIGWTLPQSGSLEGVPWPVRTDAAGIARLGPWRLADFPGEQHLAAYPIAAPDVQRAIAALAIGPPGANVFLTRWPRVTFISATPGELGLDLFVDLTSLAGRDLASLAIEVGFDSTALRFNGFGVLVGDPGWRDVNGDTASFSVDTTAAASHGRLLLSGATSAATTASFRWRGLRFAGRSGGSFVSVITLRLVHARSALGADVAGLARGTTVDVRIGESVRSDADGRVVPGPRP